MVAVPAPAITGWNVGGLEIAQLEVVDGLKTDGGGCMLGTLLENDREAALSSVFMHDSPGKVEAERRLSE